MTMVGPEDLKIIKGKDLLKLYQYHTKQQNIIFVQIVEFILITNPRSNPKMYGINVACLEGVEPFELNDVSVNDGENHPLDQKNN